MSSKLGLNLAKYYSINFDIPKKQKKIFYRYSLHWDDKRVEAIKKLCNPNSKVSSHYLIKNNGEVLNLVLIYTLHGMLGLLLKKFKLLNNTIGIEISNPGHDYTYKKFSINKLFL